ncbi:HNH endonuclease [Neobacillus sp. SCS-31]|uniref:HNH endonuclease n=1 Tax=Neobacillus oceani TaxID=3115292 RepID=UPI003905BFD2
MSGLWCNKHQNGSAPHYTRRLNGSDSIHNLITLCSTCHEKIAGEELLHSQRFYQKIKGKSISFIDAMHVMQGKTYLQKALKEIAPLNLTTGGDTANI